MHQDQRIGLALGVLLLGAAGAFFFRHDASPSGAKPQLRTAKQLDARIAEKSITPYLSGIEEDDTQRGPTARSISDRGGPPLRGSSDGSLPQLESPDFFADDSNEPFALPKGRVKTRSSQAEQEIPDLTPIPIPEVGDLSSHAGNSATQSPREAIGTTDSSEVLKTYTVQRGDSLSSIAAKELGNPNRFLEIYEANRDRLKDANDVRVGMKLRIPPRQKSSAPNSSKSKRQSDLLSDSAPPLLSPTETDGVNSNAPTIILEPIIEQERSTPANPTTPGNKKFVPVKRPPLGTRVPTTQTDSSDPKNQAGRRLSQLPPENGDGKVAR